MDHSATNASSVRKTLAKTDPENVDDLQHLFDALTASVKPADAPSNVAVSSLSEEQLFTYMGFANKVNHAYGFSSVAIPTLSIHDLDRDEYPSELLRQALLKCSRNWNNQSEAGRRLMIQLLIMEALDCVQSCDDGEASKLDDEDNYNFHQAPARLLAFSELNMSQSCTAPDGTTVLLSGCCDIGIGYLEGDESEPHSGAMLSVLQAKGSTTFDNSWPQLLAYLGIVHRARLEAGKKNTTVYGIYSDGQKYCFVGVDNNSVVCRSKTYDIVVELHAVFNFVCAILRTIRVDLEVDILDVEEEGEVDVTLGKDFGKSVGPVTRQLGSSSAETQPCQCSW